MSCRAGDSLLLCVVEDDAQAVADARCDGAHTVAQAGPVRAARPRERPVMRGEDERLSLVQGDHIAPGLRARTLLDEQQLAARVLDVPLAEHDEDLEREGDGAV